MCRIVKIVVLAALVLAPASAFAQGSIAGVVRDTSSAVMPGVTIDVSSPVMIEGARTALTDGTGQYPDRGLAARHLHRHVHAHRLRCGATGRDRGDGHLHRNGQRRTAGRVGRGNGHGHRGEPDRRRAKRRPAARHRQGGHRQHSRGARLLRLRRARPRHRLQRAGCRRLPGQSAGEQPENPRQPAGRPADDDRRQRRLAQHGGGERMGHRRRHQHGRRRGGHRRSGRRIGGSAHRRHARQLHSEGGRQQLCRQHLRQLQQPFDAGQQFHRGAQGARPADAQFDQDELGLQSLVRRAAQTQQGVVLLQFADQSCGQLRRGHVR